VLRRVLNALFSEFCRAENKLKTGGELRLHQLGSLFCLLFRDQKVRKRKPLGFQENKVKE
jgi:hypothetical protein